MPPTLILSLRRWRFPDPSLTDLGVEQCQELEKHLKLNCPLATRTEAIICSPLRRTVQTALIGLRWLIASGVPVELDAAWQENSDQPCDTGSDLTEIQDEFPELDFSTVDPVFPSKGIHTPYAYTRTAALARGETCLRGLYERPEKVIIVVSHSGFLRTAISQCRYANADYRIFTFRKSPDGRPELHEDRTTEKLGGGMGKSPRGYYPITESDFPFLENIEELFDEELNDDLDPI